MTDRTAAYWAMVDQRDAERALADDLAAALIEAREAITPNTQAADAVLARWRETRRR